MRRLLEKIDISLVKKIVIAAFCIYLAVSNVIFYAGNAKVTAPEVTYYEASTAAVRGDASFSSSWAPPQLLRW